MPWLTLTELNAKRGRYDASDMYDADCMKFILVETALNPSSDVLYARHGDIKVMREMPVEDVLKELRDLQKEDKARGNLRLSEVFSIRSKLHEKQRSRGDRPASTSTGKNAGGAKELTPRPAPRDTARGRERQPRGATGRLKTS